MAQVKMKDGWRYKGRFITIFPYTEHFDIFQKQFLEGIGLEVPREFGVIVYDGSVASYGHLNCPDIRFEDWNERRAIVEAWINKNLPPLSRWRRVLSFLDISSWIIVWENQNSGTVARRAHHASQASNRGTESN